MAVKKTTKKPVKKTTKKTCAAKAQTWVAGVPKKKHHSDRVIVITEGREGRRAYFGNLNYLDMPEGETVSLFNAREATHWEGASVFCLAKEGPTQRCRISPIIPYLRLNHVTAVLDCTVWAAREWQNYPE